MGVFRYQSPVGDRFSITSAPTRDGGALVTVGGDLDLATAPELGLALRQAGGDSSQALIVDLTEVRFIDCSALRVLVERRRWLDEAGRAMPVVCEAGGAVERLLEMTGLRGHFSVFGTVGDALTAMTAL